MNKQKSQSGFAHLMILVIILTLGLVGSLGYIFWQNFVNGKRSPALSSCQAGQTECIPPEVQKRKTASEVASWTKLETDYFKMPIPDGWKLQKLFFSDSSDKATEESGTIIESLDTTPAQSLTYEKGVRGAVEDYDMIGGRGLAPRFRLDYSFTTANITGFSDWKKSTLESDSKLVTNKYEKYYEKDFGDSTLPSVPAGSVEYWYTIEIGKGKLIFITYFVYPENQADNVVQLEQAIKAIEVK